MWNGDRQTKALSVFRSISSESLHSSFSAGEERSRERSCRQRLRGGQIGQPEIGLSGKETGDAERGADDRRHTAEHREEPSFREEIERREHQPQLEKPLS